MPIESDKMERPVNQTMVSAELPRVPEAGAAPGRAGSRPAPDFERFRLRRFVEDLVQIGECVVHDEPIALAHIAGVLDGNPKAVWFRNVGPEGAELVGNVMGSRRRLACALNVSEAGFADELRRRLTAAVRADRSDVHRGPGTSEGADRRGCRSDPTARPPSARIRRCTIHFRQHRLRAQSEDRGHKSGLPPDDAAVSAHGRHRS